MTAAATPPIMPLFPTALLSQGMIFTGSVIIPTQLPSGITPIITASPSLPAAQSPIAQHTPAQNGLVLVEAERKAAADSVSENESIPIPFELNDGVVELNDHPRRLLRDIRNGVINARTAIVKKNAALLAAAASEIMKNLETPVNTKASGAAPLHTLIEKGTDLLIEAGMAAFGFTGPETTAAAAEWINNADVQAGTTANPLNHVRLQLIQAYKVMQESSTGKGHPNLYYNSALSIIEETRTWAKENISDEKTRLEAYLFTNLLRIEILAQQLALAVRCRNRREKRRLTKEISQPFKELAVPQNKQDRTYIDNEKILAKLNDPVMNALVAKYSADVVLLMASLGMWHHALKRARILTTNKLLKDTPDALKVLKHPLIEPFVDAERGENGEIMDSRDIKSEAAPGAVGRFLIEAVSQAYSPRFGYSVVAGAAGLMGGEIINTLALDSSGMTLPLISAVVFSMLHRLIHGLRSDEARDAYSIGGGPKQGARKAAWSLAKLFAKGIVDAAAWAGPAYLMGDSYSLQFILDMLKLG
jgi:hypothetical protein